MDKKPRNYKKAIDEYKIRIPDNMRIVISSLYVNKPITMEYLKKHGYDKFIHAVFTVFTEEYAREHDVLINCGARSCITCGRCYNLVPWNIIFINELLK